MPPLAGRNCKLAVVEAEAVAALVVVAALAVAALAVSLMQLKLPPPQLVTLRSHRQDRQLLCLMHLTRIHAGGASQLSAGGGALKGPSAYPRQQCGGARGTFRLSAEKCPANGANAISVGRPCYQYAQPFIP